MPNYVIECKSCCVTRAVFDKVFDVIHFCDLCGLEMTKKITKPGKPVFKGSGFYETDYKQTREKKK